MKISTEKLRDNQINIDWMKPSKTYLVTEKIIFLACLASWFLILGIILFS